MLFEFGRSWDVCFVSFNYWENLAKLYQLKLVYICGINMSIFHFRKKKLLWMR